MDNLAVLMEAQKELCRENVGLINGYAAAAAFYKLAPFAAMWMGENCVSCIYAHLAIMPFCSVNFATEQISTVWPSQSPH
jgi:hypothetical protein